METFWTIVKVMVCIQVLRFIFSSTTNNTQTKVVYVNQNDDELEKEAIAVQREIKKQKRAELKGYPYKERN